MMFVLAATAGPAAAQPTPPRWEQLLGWLPENTETLIVAPGPFKIPAAKLDHADVPTVLQFLPTLPIGSLHEGFVSERLKGLKVVCAVEGSRRFTVPGEFGMMPYEGCHIVQFEASADEALQKMVTASQEKAGKTIEVAGVRVAVFTEIQEQDTWTYYVCRPRPGVLLCATDRGYLEETLKRIDRKPGTRAMPADLPEWKHVDTKAPVWAIRHYRAEFAKEDPTSPLRADEDPTAVGFVFWCGGDRDTPVRARYLSRRKDLVEQKTGIWDRPGDGLRSKVRRLSSDVVEVTPAVTDENVGIFLFVLLQELGHGIVV
jgi:hypothetical protein